MRGETTLSRWTTTPKSNPVVRHDKLRGFRSMKARALIILSTITADLQDAPVQAHVNWFVESGSEPLESYAISDPIFLLWSGLVIGLVCFSIWLDGRLPTPRIVDSKTRQDFMELLRILTGMSFLLTAYEGALAAPHQAVSGVFGTLLLFLQAAIGIILIANRWMKFAAVAMLVLHRVPLSRPSKCSKGALPERLLR